MGTAVFTFQICPKCRGRLASGWPRFGPAAVKCGHCGSVLNTGLSSWSALSGPAKAFTVAKELLVPSFLPFRGIDKALSLMVGVMMIGMWVPIPFVLFYVAKQVRLSNEYDRTHEPPTWNYGRQKL